MRVFALALVLVGLGGCAGSNTARGDDDGVSGNGSGAGSSGSGGSAAGSGGRANGGATGSAGTGNGGGPICQKEVTFSNVVVEKPEPFDVVIVADHSGSISWSRASLTEGLQNLLEYVHGQEVRFFLLTPTQYGASSEKAVTAGNAPLVSFRDPVTQQAYRNAITEYTLNCTGVNGAAVDCEQREEYYGTGFTLKGRWEFQLPEPLARITPDMSESDVAAEQTKIADSILALGSDGAQIEQPLCSLHRYLGQVAAELPKHVVFLVLSDEDDASTPDQCLLSYTYAETGEPADSPCDANCEFTRYSATFIRAVESNEYTCMPVDDDGTRHPEGSYRGGGVSGGNPECTPGPATPCGAAQQALAQEFCGEGYVAEDCMVSCGGGSGYTCFVDLPLPDISVDACSQSFSLNGTSYANIADYCERTYQDSPFLECKGDTYNHGGSVRYFGMETIEKLVDVATTAELAAAFTARADAAFGAGEYFVATILHDAAFDCVLSGGQSYGTTLKTLATTPADVFPLCGDYAPALQRIRSFAQRLVKTDYHVTLKEDEELGAVSLTDRTGNERTLLPSDYDFDPATGMLSLHDGVLAPNDVSLQLRILRACSLR
jgi:hypothetical protein